MADLVEQVFGADPEVPEPSPPEPTTEPAPEAVPEPQSEPPASIPEPAIDERIPLRTYLDTREEAKEYKRRVQELEARLNQPQVQKAPDSYDDPEGFTAYLESKVEERLTAARFKTSERFAKKAYGQEAVQTAVEWAQAKAQADPSFAIGYMQDDDPIDWIVRQHKRDALLGDIGEDPDAYVRRRAAELGLLATATAAPIPVAVAPATKPAPPPRSIASDAPASRTALEDNNADFMAIFNKR